MTLPPNPSSTALKSTGTAVAVERLTGADVPAVPDGALSNKRLAPSNVDPRTGLQAFRRLSISELSDISFHAPTRDAAWHPPASSRCQQLISSTPWLASVQRFLWRNRGLVMVTGSQFFGSLMNTFARLLENDAQPVHPLHLLLVRMTLTSIVCCLYMWRTKVPHFPVGPPGTRLLLVVRGFLGFFGVMGMYYSLLYLPVADATVLTFLAPGVAGILCYLLLGEPFTRVEQMATALSLVGVVLIARPVTLLQLLLPSPTADVTTTTTSVTAPAADVNTEHQVTAAEQLAAVGYAMIGVAGTAGSFVAMRWIGKRAHPLITVNYFAVFSIFISLGLLTMSTFFTPSLAPVTGTFSSVVPSSLKQLGMLLALTLSGLVLLYLLTAGLAAESSNRANNMVYTSLLYALVFDRIIFDQVPGMWSLLGSGLIMGSAVWVAVSKSDEQEMSGRDYGAEEMQMQEHQADEERAMLQDMDELHDDAEELTESWR